VSLEARTLAAEINILGQLRDRISLAARYGDPIQVRYHRLNYKTTEEQEQSAYLTEGFPVSDRGSPLTALLVVDNFTALEMMATTGESEPRIGQYAGDRLYLSKDRKWIRVERIGAYSEEVGSPSQWDAACRVLSDHSLHARYSLDTVAEGLFAATNRLWEKLAPRMDTLNKRNSNVQRISALLGTSKAGLPSEIEQPAPTEQTRKSSLFLQSKARR
jgi:hypothetical protein